MRIGVIGASVTIALGFLLAELGLASHWGFLLILPLTSSTYWLLAGVTGTCFWTGMKGGRQEDYGFEPVLDLGQSRSLRRRGWMLVAVSLTLACVSAGAFVVSV
ncbi:MAG TPA: hypothetical protein VG937_36745 [Polyangiaceae bacterium]|nr:hypothetical protein [Polyangiaceae bacterium]